MVLGMGYLARIVWKQIVMSLPQAFTPLFYVNGKFIEKWDPVRLEGDSMILAPSESDKSVLRVFQPGKGRRIVEIHIRLQHVSDDRYLSFINSVGRGVLVEAVGEDKLQLKLGENPDATHQKNAPSIIPVRMKRIMFNQVKRLPSRLVIFLNRSPLKEDVDFSNYVGVHHMGGLLFKFARSMFEERRPFFPIVRKQYSSVGLKKYIVIPQIFMVRSGLKGEFKCVDYIMDIDGNKWLNLIPREKCMPRNKRLRALKMDVDMESHTVVMHRSVEAERELREMQNEKSNIQD